MRNKLITLMMVLFAAVVFGMAGCGDGSGTSAQSLSENITPSTSSKQVALATSSEVDTLLNSAHETSWAYFQDPQKTVWYIAHPSGVTYALGRNSKNHASWVSIGNESNVASVDFYNKSVAVNSNTYTSSQSYKAISLVWGEATESISGSVASLWAKKIEGYNMPAAWYFFRVESTGVWYIVLSQGTSSKILRLELTADKSQYDWQKPVDADGVAVNTANWKKEFFYENGKWQVKFSDPLNAAIALVKQTQIGQELKASIDSLRSEGKLVLCGSDWVPCPPAVLKVYGSVDISSNIDNTKVCSTGATVIINKTLNKDNVVAIASDIVHEVTHYEDFKKIATGAMWNTNGLDTEAKAYANQQKFFDQAKITQSQKNSIRSSADLNVLSISYGYEYAGTNSKSQVYDVLYNNGKGYSAVFLANVYNPSDFCW